jgi:stearoyl-CoA desaturase (delta-9 desaturase)
LTNKFRILHLLTHGLALFGFFWLLRTGDLRWAGIAFIFFLYAGIFGVNIALHRYFAHHSFETNRAGYWLLLVSSILPMLGSPTAWGSIHRFHHTHSDSEVDPHNPNTIGVLRSWFTAWPDVTMPLSVFRSFNRDKNVAFLHRHFFTIAFSYAAILALIDWRLAVFVFAIPAVGCYHGAAAIAVIPHMTGWGGYKNHETEDNSHNNFIAWVFSLGEGWHNNHHAKPNNYRHGEKWWELDPSAFIIKHFLKVRE